MYEELECEDAERARQVYRAALDLIPHKRFTFAKMWLLYAHFEIRQKNVAVARKALGTALGKCPKTKLFRGYIGMLALCARLVTLGILVCILLTFVIQTWRYS